MTTAQIVKDNNDLWMVVDGDDQTAWPITEEEVEPIMMACQLHIMERIANTIKELKEEEWKNK
jgi:hypothetical protein